MWFDTSRPTFLNNKYKTLLLNVQSFCQKLQTFVQTFPGENCKAFLCNFLWTKTTNPSQYKFFRSAILLEKNANIPMTHNYSSPPHTQETYWVGVIISKATLYFYNVFLLLSLSYCSIWNFCEYSLKNWH